MTWWHRSFWGSVSTMTHKTVKFVSKFLVLYNEILLNIIYKSDEFIQRYEKLLVVHTAFFVATIGISTSHLISRGKYHIWKYQYLKLKKVLSLKKSSFNTKKCRTWACEETNFTLQISAHVTSLLGSKCQVPNLAALHTQEFKPDFGDVFWYIGSK